MISLIQNFEADFLRKQKESQPQNSEFRNNPENFHPWFKPVTQQIWLD